MFCSVIKTKRKIIKKSSVLHAEGDFPLLHPVCAVCHLWAGRGGKLPGQQVETVTSAHILQTEKHLCTMKKNFF